MATAENAEGASSEKFAEAVGRGPTSSRGNTWPRSPTAFTSRFRYAEEERKLQPNDPPVEKTEE